MCGEAIALLHKSTCVCECVYFFSSFPLFIGTAFSSVRGACTSLHLPFKVYATRCCGAPLYRAAEQCSITRCNNTEYENTRVTTRTPDLFTVSLYGGHQVRHGLFSLTRRLIACGVALCNTLRFLKRH